MKNLLIILGVIIICSCTQTTPQQKAEKLIKQNLFETLHDFGSYEPVLFSSLDSAFSEAVDDPKVIKELDKYLFYKEKYNDLFKSLNENKTHEEKKQIIKLAYQAIDSIELYNNRTSAANGAFIPKQIGWKIDHKFRSKTLGGNMKLANYKYIFNVEITKIIRTIDLDDEKDKK